MRPKTDNSIEHGSGNTQIGHNTGEVHVGLTFEQHQHALSDALASKTTDLERAHGAEKEVLQREADELRRRLSEVETDYRERLEELAALKAELAKFQNRFDKDKFEAANAALDRNDSSLAEALFKELLNAAEARREDAEQDEAGLHYRLGKIAEDAVRWHDAYTNYKRASELHETFDHLTAYARMTWRLAKGTEAVGVHEQIVDWVKSEHGEKSAEYAICLNNLAGVVKAQGRYAQAEDLYREALQIGRTTIGEGHPNYAIRLNNLAGVVKVQGRHEEAEGLFREALEIDRATIGTEHPAYATHLNNLASVVRAQERYAEADGLYRKALKIDRATIGEGHPDYAIHLSNLAGVVEAQARYPEAEGLFWQALEITRTALGEGHPAYAIRLNNLAGVLAKLDRAAEARPLLEQALAIFRARLPADHPHIGAVKRRLAALPDD